MDQEFRKHWNKKPNNILLSYSKIERAKVEEIWPSGNRWNNDIKYPNIKLIFFKYCDRGISCWKEFNIFLKNVFPNLEVIFLNQSWTYDNTHSLSDNEISDIEKKELYEFMDDKWLKIIWIMQECNSISGYNDIISENIRVFHTNRNCIEYCGDQQCYNDLEMCCCCTACFN